MSDASTASSQLLRGTLKPPTCPCPMHDTRPNNSVIRPSRQIVTRGEVTFHPVCASMAYRTHLDSTERFTPGISMDSIRRAEYARTHGCSAGDFTLASYVLPYDLQPLQACDGCGDEMFEFIPPTGCTMTILTDSGAGTMVWCDRPECSNDAIETGAAYPKVGKVQDTQLEIRINQIGSDGYSPNHLGDELARIKGTGTGLDIWLTHRLDPEDKESFSESESGVWRTIVVRSERDSTPPPSTEETCPDLMGV
jgi:hypothetical protein